jgi:hypothetical protein
MLSIAFSVFFALAFLGSIAVIAMMFFQYQDRIASVIQNELRVDSSNAVFPSSAYRHRAVKASQLMTHHRALQPAPLRVAA